MADYVPKYSPWFSQTVVGDNLTQSYYVFNNLFGAVTQNPASNPNQIFAYLKVFPMGTASYLTYIDVPTLSLPVGLKSQYYNQTRQQLDTILTTLEGLSKISL